MKRPSNIIILSALLLLVAGTAFGQESVFTGLKSDIKRADKYYGESEYKNALDLYLAADKKGKNGTETYLKLGRTYFHLKDYENSAIWYDRYYTKYNSLPDDDLYSYAEALRSSGEYEKAVLFYKQYQLVNPDDKLIIEKIWRLTNIKFLLEDSIHYSVKLADIRRSGSNSCPVFYKNGIVFVGDKQEVGGIEKLDGMDNSPFKTLYFTLIQRDTINSLSDYKFVEAVKFGEEVTSIFNTGALTFFPGNEKIIFTKNSEFIKDQGSRLQLFIAENIDGEWQEITSLPFNSMSYSVSDPALSQDGTTLYFVSDMPGGFGKKDLYESYYVNETWTKPVNLGEKINTKGDETNPYEHNSNLYFSSNGHGGLGGLDIYKIDPLDIASAELINLGYPVNSSFDDFGIALNDDGTSGFISSNRLQGGFNDKIYEIELDLQLYPLTINGTVKYKELQWRGSDRDELLKNANLLLFDTRRNKQVGHSKTDSLGNFALEIPYASNFALKISSPNIGEITVKLEVPKNKKPDSVHDIVIVKNRVDVKED